MLKHPETRNSWEQLPGLGLNIQGEEQGYQMLVRGGAGEWVTEAAVVIEGLGHSQHCSTEVGRKWGTQWINTSNSFF